MSHFYTKSGELITDITIREARQQGLLPSVTTVTKASWDNPQLTKWKITQLLKLLKEKPQNLNLTENQIMDWYYDETGKAMKKGSDIHDEIEKYLTGKKSKIDKELKSWIDENIFEVYEIEKRLVNNKFAGTIDLICDLKDYGLSILDWKTQGFDKYPVVYDDYKFQLVAYKQLVDFNSTEFKKHNLVDVFISTNNELIVPKVMKQDVRDWATSTWNKMIEYYYTRRKL